MIIVYANRLRITLETDQGSTAGYSAEVIELTSDQPVNLPIVLQSFEVIQQNESVQLLWSTSSEINNSHFLIEKADDEGKFKTIGRVEGNGTSASKNHYSFTDFDPYIGNNYYRLTQVDYNGKSESFDPHKFHLQTGEDLKFIPILPMQMLTLFFKKPILRS